MLAEPRHEPKVRQGVTTELIGVDGNAYAPFPSREDLRRVRRPQRRPRRPARASPTTGRRSPSTSHRYDRRDLGQRRLRRRQQRRSGSRPSAGTRSRPTPARWRTSGAILREAMEDGAFGLSSGLDYPPGAYATTEELGAAHGRGGASSAASTTPTSGIRSATGSSTRSGRRSRSGAAAARRSTSPTSITGRRSRARRSTMLGLVDDARAEGLDVTLRPVSVRVVEHAAADHAADVDPGRRRRAAEGAPGRSVAPGSGSGPRWPRAAGCSPGIAPGTRCGSARFTRPEHLAWEGRTLGDVMRGDRAATRSTRSATCSLAEDLRVNQVTPGPHIDGIRPFLRHPAAMIGTDGVLIGGQAVAAHVRLVPADPRRVRARGAAARARGGGPPDDRDARRRGWVSGIAAVLADGLGADLVAVRPGHGPHAGDLRRAAPVPGRASPTSSSTGRSVVDGGRAHRRDAGDRAAPGTSRGGLTLGVAKLHASPNSTEAPTP